MKAQQSQQTRTGNTGCDQRVSIRQASSADYFPRIKDGDCMGCYVTFATELGTDTVSEERRSLRIVGSILNPNMLTEGVGQLFSTVCIAIAQPRSNMPIHQTLHILKIPGNKPNHTHQIISPHTSLTPHAVTAAVQTGLPVLDSSG